MSVPDQGREQLQIAQLVRVQWASALLACTLLVEEFFFALWFARLYCCSGWGTRVGQLFPSTRQLTFSWALTETRVRQLEPFEGRVIVRARSSPCAFHEH
ncbi:hypothetical protein DPMN_047973 [Dreissena polymorpha]|uniref:Uncharacterized protein n=1 Tax=Dreissena polymorpha TaxID=45954 RepID=A0A9D4DAQ3_DREPO|nr:hypothetical protein DPMN_047973 [Dreissena polymorpha]